VLFAESQHGSFALGETAIEGVPLYTRLHRGNARAFAYQATDWLCNLILPSASSPPALSWQDLIRPLIEEFETTFGSALDSALLDKSRSILEQASDVSFAYEHRDFSPWNVVVRPDGTLGVLDWEGARPVGLPVQDLAYFLAHLGFFLDGAYSSRRFRQSYRASLDPTTLTGSLRVQCMERYRRRVGLHDAIMQPLNLLVWLIHARSEYQRLVADLGVSPPAHRLRTALFVSLWEEELGRLSPASR
jgi:thiamine kinase-like enzyme